MPAGFHCPRSGQIVAAASAATLAIGLFFVFVWAPHPWGWEGFDHYHELALTLASGQSFPTMEVPWGYAYFAAAVYRLFGDHPAVLLVIQVALNAAMPYLIYRFASEWTNSRTATMAAVLTGVLSFNTVYASTQSSDAVCTVIFMTALVAFAAARRRDRVSLSAATGLLTGIAAQFRPNLVLIPVCLAAFAWLESRSRRRALHAIVLLGCATAALAPWVARNYRLTRTVLPTSVHGGVQLWYGTLQVGPYLQSRAYNPRAVFEAPVFDYTSLDTEPIQVAAHPNPCGETPPASATLVFWTDRDPRRQRLAAKRGAGGREDFRFEIPAPGGDVVVYYYFESIWPRGGGAATVSTPPEGAAAPFVYFVTHDHLGDSDVHGDLLDVFDLIRIARHAAWNEPVMHADRLASAGIGGGDVQSAARLLARAVDERLRVEPVVTLAHDRDQATLTFHDGSVIIVPRAWSGRITDIGINGPLALAIMSTRISLAGLAQRAHTAPPSHDVACAQLQEVAVNRDFYRAEPHLMRRYWALAIDNIRRDPAGFAWASLYRALRVFVIQGTGDRFTSQQFARSARIYGIASVATVAYLGLFVVGAAIAWRRGDPVALPLLLVAYVPATIAPVLTNMRYSVTIQPIVFVFIAAALTAAWDRAAAARRGAAGRDRGDTRTAPSP